MGFFLPHKLKINLIKTLTHRALTVCSESTFESEIKFVSKTLCNYNFLLSVVQTIIGNRITEFIKIKQVSVQKYPVYLCLLRLGGIRERFAKQITQTAQRCYFSSNIHAVFHTKPILGSIHKDVLPPHHNNSIIYLFMCSYSFSYIGSTNQRLYTTCSSKICNFMGDPTDNLRNAYESFL